MNNIRSIYIGTNNRINYLVIEDKNEIIILNITEGIVENNLRISLDNIEYIYNDGLEYKERIELAKIIKVSLISNVDLINIKTNKNISSPYLLEIEDENHKCLYVDVAFNQTYMRNNHYILKEYSNTKERYLFKSGSHINIFRTMFIIRFIKKIRFILEIEEEDII